MTYKKKLIEVTLPLGVINGECAKQKNTGAAPHPQNLHRWWARRPLAAARAVLWASLVDDPSSNPDRFPTSELQQLERKRLFGILERLIPWEAAHDQHTLNDARAEIESSCDGTLPLVLDPFGGGGSIPLEALRLGLPTATGDLNPVAVLIQRAMFDIPSRFGQQHPVWPGESAARVLWNPLEGLASDVQSYGDSMLDSARQLIGDKYRTKALDEAGVTPIVWVWARTVRSPDPSWNGHVPLVKSWELVKKAGKPSVWIDPIIDEVSQSITYEVRQGGSAPDGAVSRQGGRCIATGASMPFSYIREEALAGRMGARLIAVVGEGPQGRTYLTGTPEDEAAAELECHAPISGPIPRQLTGGTCAVYGLDDWSKVFTPRQSLALTTFSNVLRSTHDRIRDDALAAGLPATPSRFWEGGDGATAYADAITTYLAFVVDRCADNWSSVCSWHLQNAQVKQTFALQAVPMTWDFVEVNPFSGRMASWTSMLKGVVRAITTLIPSGVVQTAQRDAKARIKESGIAMVSTDPPYYDNISYADLSDFFYVWLRHNLADIWPDECATLLTPKTDELISSTHRAGSRDLANQHFESGIREVFSTASEFADERYPTTIFYAFKASESTDDGIVSTGWETFLTGLLDAGFAITATWPLRTETTIGIKAGKSTLASSIVLACRKRLVSAPLATRGEFIGALRAEMDPAIRLLQLENIAPVDLAQSAIGPGIAIFSRYAKVVEADGSNMGVRTALGLINEVLGEILSGEESEFDADTRFAVTWFEQFGHLAGPFGDADLLARAKDTTVIGVDQAGIAISRDGKVRLLRRNELPEAWDPARDSRLTVWEATQHLIRSLESSELNAASLLSRLGQGLGERARQLAYLLYGISERKKWSDDAAAYNMLVTAWPEISRLTATADFNRPAETLF